MLHGIVHSPNYTLPIKIPHAIIRMICKEKKHLFFNLNFRLFGCNFFQKQVLKKMKSVSNSYQTLPLDTKHVIVAMKLTNMKPFF